MYLDSLTKLWKKVRGGAYQIVNVDDNVLK